MENKSQRLAGSPHLRARLLFLESLSTISGGQMLLLNLVRGLSGQYDISVFMPGAGPLSQALDELGVHCYYVPVGQYSLVHKTPGDLVNYVFRLPWLIFLTWRFICRQQIDLIYANSGRTFVWGTIAALLSRRPILWHHHNMLADAKTLWVLRLLGRLPVMRRLICVCQAARQQFPGLMTKSVVIYNGIDLTRFQVQPGLGHQIRQELNISAQSPVVAIVGDLTPHKGQHIFLRAAQLVHKAVPDAVFVVIGRERDTVESHQYAAELHRLAGELGLEDHVLWPGYRSDMERVLNAIQVLVVGSLAAETTSLVLQEAMACGKIVVGSRTGGIPEMIQDGRTGYLYDPGDYQALAGQIITALSPSGDGIGEAGRTLAHEQFGLPCFVAQIQSVIHQALLKRQ